MFEDFSFCTECNYYDSKERRCNLFNRQIRVCGCQYGEDKPRNNFERLKAMSIKEMAELLFRKFQDIYEAVTKDGAYFGKRDMMLWLKEETRE